MKTSREPRQRVGEASLYDHASVNRGGGSLRNIIAQKSAFVNDFRKNISQKFRPRMWGNMYNFAYSVKDAPLGARRRGICDSLAWGGRKKDAAGVFSFHGLRGRAHKKGTPGASPSYESSPPLRSGDSALWPQTDSGVPACRPLGRDKIGCKSVQIVSSLYVAVETTKLHVVPAVSQDSKYIGIRPPLFVRA